MTSRRWFLALLMAAAVAPYFMNLGATSIIDANEAFYTETPREMIEAGDYLNPSFNYEPRFNKPPLSYWVVAAAYQALGQSLASARLPIAMGAMVMLATVFLLGRIAFGTRAGVMAALSLAATPRLLLFSRRIIIDVYTAMFVGLTLLFFVLAETEPRRRRRWLIAMYVAVGLGVLTKGPVAAVLPALVFTVYLAASGRLRTLRHMMVPSGIAIVSLMVVPYYAALYAQHGGQYITTFLLDENLARYAEGVGAPDRGPLFYLPVVFADFYFPWSLLLPVALALVPWRHVWHRRGSSPRDGGLLEPVSSDTLRLLYGLWIVLIVGFFSFSKAQQDLYVLPFVVAAAPLVGGLVDALFSGTLSVRLARATRWSLVVTSVVLALLGAILAWFVGVLGQPIHVAGAWAAGLLLVGGAVLSVWFLTRQSLRLAMLVSRVGSSVTNSPERGARIARRERREYREYLSVEQRSEAGCPARSMSANFRLGTLALLTAVVAGQWILVVRALPDFERYKPVPHLAQAVQRYASPHARIGTFKVATPSLVFYLRRHVAQMFDETQVQAFFREHPDAYCVMRAEDYEAVKARIVVPTRVLAVSPRFDAQPRDFLSRSPLPNLVLVTNRR